jgi:hypothetical protein
MEWNNHFQFLSSVLYIIMVCAISCAIAFILIVANIYCCVFSHRSGGVIQEFVAKLSPDNQRRYAVITRERQGIYFMGLFLGFILSMILLVCCRKYFLGSGGGGGGGRGGNAGALCMVAAVTFSVNYFYYILSPKSDWMVLHLKSGEETQAWLKVYRTMQYNYHIGLVLGIVAVVAFGNALCSA